MGRRSCRQFCRDLVPWSAQGNYKSGSFKWPSSFLRYDTLLKSGFLPYWSQHHFCQSRWIASWSERLVCLPKVAHSSGLSAANWPDRWCFYSAASDLCWLYGAIQTLKAGCRGWNCRALGVVKGHSHPYAFRIVSWWSKKLAAIYWSGSFNWCGGQRTFLPWYSARSDTPSDMPLI